MGEVASFPSRTLDLNSSQTISTQFRSSNVPSPILRYYFRSRRSFKRATQSSRHLRSHCDSRRYPESVEGAEAPFDRGEVRISLGALNEVVLDAELLDLVGSLRDSTYETR
jgi:hypothetical protein